MDTGKSQRQETNTKGAQQRKKYIRWALLSTILTFSLSFVIYFISEASIKDSPLAVALFVLLVIVLIGIVFDVLGTAVTAADEAPFHSMAAQKVRGAVQGIRLIRSAERVSNICNDVVGDICGIISGSTTAAIVARLFSSEDAAVWSGLAVTACVASLTVGGKAFGKGVAISRSNDIVFAAAKVLSVFEKDMKHGKKRKSSK